MKLLILCFFMLLNTSLFSHTLYKQSVFDYETTIQKIKKIMADNSLEILISIDHAKSAKLNKLYMPPSVVMIFGNAQLNTSLMQDNPAWSIHLPFEVAVYNDSKGNTWIAMPDIKKYEKKLKASPPQKSKLSFIKVVLNKILNLN